MTDQQARRILVTGGAGFIGSHLVDALLQRGDRVTVLDNFNSFYEAKIKRLNVAPHQQNPSYTLFEGDIRHEETLTAVFAKGPFDAIVHLAAMAGVRPSLSDPSLYMDVNVLGLQRLLDQIRKQSLLPRLVFGSSSSVYGERAGEEFKETDVIVQPLSPYAASKAAGELLCHAAHHTTALPVVALRFFTVYGPRQRPDLAIHKFCLAIEAGEPVELYGDGTTSRDYTFVGDIVSGIIAAIDSDLQFEIINLGRSEPVSLMEMVRSVESAVGKPALIQYKPPQMGDVPYTHANIEKARKLLRYSPSTSLDEGVRRFVAWHRQVTETLAAAGLQNQR